VDESNELHLLCRAASAEVAARGDGGSLADGTPSEPVNGWKLLEPALSHMLRVAASDLHLKAGSRPRVRVRGHLHPAPLPVLSDADCEAVVAATMPARQAGQFGRTNEADYAIDVEGYGRFRLSAFRERGRCALAVRRVATQVPSARSLGLLPAVQQLAARTSGLCLVSGRVGSGKTATLAWIVDRINDTRDSNVVMIEDPIEYLHADKRSIIHQREVGTDTESFAEALRRALRQDPDILVIGEIRDEETAQIALSAAQTGHLVFATLHSDTAAETVDRFIELLSPANRNQGRLSLAGTLHAVVCQRLMSRAGDHRRVLLQEILVSTGRIAQRIIDPNLIGPSIADMIVEDEHLGMVSFDQHLHALYQSGRIGRRDALLAASHPHDLSLRIDRTPPGGAERINPPTAA
jgi:twitching motility protein PilT